VSAVNRSGGSSAGKKIVAAVLAVIAILLIIQGIMYLVEPAKNLLIDSISAPPARANATRPLRGAGALVIAVICLLGAWFTIKGQKPSSTAASSSGQSTPAAQ
jgi:Na+/H+ antiporter NhaD/arsenite permease-like protein